MVEIIQVPELDFRVFVHFEHHRQLHIAYHPTCLDQVPSCSTQRTLHPHLLQDQPSRLRDRRDIRSTHLVPSLADSFRIRIVSILNVSKLTS